MLGSIVFQPETELPQAERGRGPGFTSIQVGMSYTFSERGARRRQF